MWYLSKATSVFIIRNTILPFNYICSTTTVTIWHFLSIMSEKHLVLSADMTSSTSTKELQLKHLENQNPTVWRKSPHLYENQSLGIQCPSYSSHHHKRTCQSEDDKDDSEFWFRRYHEFCIFSFQKHPNWTNCLILCPAWRVNASIVI